MPYYKCDMFFALDGLGWMESWWTNATNGTIALDRINILALARAKCLGKQVQHVNNRVSSIEVVGDSRVSGPNPLQAAKSSRDADRAQIAVTHRIEAGTKYRRMFLMRGLPDDLITMGKAGTVYSGQWYPFEPDLLESFKPWQKALTNGDWQLRVSDKESFEARLPGNTILTVGPVTGKPGRTELTLTSNTGVDIGGYILIRKALGCDAPLWNRKRLVVHKPAANKIQIAYPYADYQRLRLTWKGVILTRYPTFRVITRTEAIRWGIRQTGSQPGLPRGRHRCPRNVCPVPAI